MKTFVSVSALLAAALAALIFPAMKPILLLVPFALALLAFTTGCGHTIERQLRKLPDGHVGKFTISQGNLGVSATITGETLDKNGNAISAQKLNATLNTPWSGTTIFNLEDWRADVSPDSHPRKAPATAPLSRESMIELLKPVPAVEPEKPKEVTPPVPAPVS